MVGIECSDFLRNKARKEQIKPSSKWTGWELRVRVDQNTSVKRKPLFPIEKRKKK